MNFIKRITHNYLIDQLKKKLPPDCIDLENKKISFGLFSIQAMFFTPFDDLVCQLLYNYYGYEFYEDKISFTFCPPVGLNERYRPYPYIKPLSLKEPEPESAPSDLSQLPKSTNL